MLLTIDEAAYVLGIGRAFVYGRSPDEVAVKGERSSGTSLARATHHGFA